MLKEVVRIAWRAGREFSSIIRWIFYASLPGTYFKTMGRGSRFFGRLRFGSIEGNISVGKNCWIGHDVFLSATRGSFIEVEDGVSFNTGCHIVAAYGITVRANTHFGEYCSIRDQNHNFDSLEKPINEQGFSGSPIKIGQNVWVGRGVLIGPGVEIGDGAVIGANSVVTCNIPPFAVAVGAPARVIRMRGEPRIKK